MLVKAEIAELLGPGQLHFRQETLDSDQLKQGHVLARTVASIVSVGTEGAAYRGAAPLRPMKVYPRLVGYCNVAEVLVTGPGVNLVKPGDRILTNQSHRTAFTCAESQILAIVPPDMDPSEAATTYLFNLGLNALQKGGFEAGQRVAIIGLGILGLTAAAMAAVLGGWAIGISDQNFAPAVAARFKLAGIIPKSPQDTADRVRAVAGEAGIDLVVLTSDHWRDWQVALTLPRQEGTISVVGFPGRNAPPPDFNPLASQYFYDRQLRIIAVGFPHRPRPGVTLPTLAGNCALILKLIADGSLPARDLISDTVPWNELGKVYERAVSRTAGYLTSALTWPA